jgi:hypothetical protein
MDVVVFTVAVLAAGLVMASGVWVATVLMAIVARGRRPTTSAVESWPSEQADP